MYWKNIFGYSIRSLFSLSSAYNSSCMGMYSKWVLFTFAALYQYCPK